MPDAGANANEQRAAWVLAAARELKARGSWTGRIHIHKLLYVTKALRVGNPPFEFVLYDYGPYSFELDEEIVNVELQGLLNRSYPKPGYGPRYEPSFTGVGVADGLLPRDAKAVRAAAEALDARNSQELELVATCLWIEENDKLKDDDAIVDRVLQLKPKYAAVREKVSSALRDARGIRAALSASGSIEA